jgi:ribosomal-protein-alanine N-acetyltransferase
MEINILTPEAGKPEEALAQEIVSFLFHHLDEFGDETVDIRRCLDYVFAPDRSGYVVVAREGGEIVGCVIVNETGMGGYIPENILVYIAVHREHRGKGLGKKLMQAALAQAKGAVALHVEPNNPARYLYEKLGFTNKYLEMRWKP